MSFIGRPGITSFSLLSSQLIFFGINILSQRPNDCHFASEILKRIYLNRNMKIFIENLQLKFLMVMLTSSVQKMARRT